MKAKIIITPKKAVVDPQGITVLKALEHMGYQGVAGVHVGKYIEIDLAPGTDAAAATVHSTRGRWPIRMRTLPGSRAEPIRAWTTAVIVIAGQAIR